MTLILSAHHIKLSCRLLGINHTISYSKTNVQFLITKLSASSTNMAADQCTDQSPPDVNAVGLCKQIRLTLVMVNQLPSIVITSSINSFTWDGQSYNIKKDPVVQFMVRSYLVCQALYNYALSDFHPHKCLSPSTLLEGYHIRLDLNIHACMQTGKFICTS